METLTQRDRAALLTQAVEVLNRYQKFSGEFRVSFSLQTDTGEILARLERADGVPFAPGVSPKTAGNKLACLHHQTAVIRPFFSGVETTEAEMTVRLVNFDYALVIIPVPGQVPALKALYFLPTDALLDHRTPDEEGSYHISGLAGYFVYQLGLDPQHKASRILFLADRMREELECRFDRGGYFYSNSPSQDSVQ